MKKFLTVFCVMVCVLNAAADNGRYELANFMMPITITNSGSYVVTENLTGTGADGITINADHVTIDLNGFQLSGIGGANGIRATARQNIRVANGVVRNWGFGLAMLSCSNGAAREIMCVGNIFTGLELGSGSLMQDCNVFQCGIGAQVGEACVVSHCIFRDNGSVGLLATNGSCSISYCAARANGNDGMRVGAASVIVGCTLRSNSGDGIEAGQGTQISDCVGYQNDDGFRTVAGGGNIVNSVAFGNRLYGFNLGEGAQLAQSVANGNIFGGVLVSSNCYVQTVNASENSTNAFTVTGMANRLDLNHASANQIGFIVTATNNLVVRNSSAGNVTSNYSIVAANLAGNITSDTNTNGPWVNFTH
jgi:hypothetical protein